MAAQTFQHQYFINAPVDQIYAHLKQPESYIGLSPLIVSVTDVQQGHDEQGRETCSYVSVERFRFLGLIRYDNHIRVLTTFTQPERQIISDVDSPFNVQVEFTFDFLPQDKGTLVAETVKAAAPSFLMNFVVSQAKAVQLARARILKARMEAGS